MEDKVKKIYGVVTQTPELKDAFSGITEAQFREALKDEKAQDALYDDLVAYDLVTKSDPQTYWTKMGLRQPKQQASTEVPPLLKPQSLLDITRKQIQTPMAQEQLPFKQVGVLASDKGPDLGETKPTYGTEAMGLAFNPMIQSAIKVVKGFFSKDTGIKDNKTPHFDWSPLANYEQAQTKHREADKEFQKLESESKRHGAGAGYGEYDAGTHLKLSKEIPVLKSKAEKSLLEASPTIDKIIEDSYKNADKTKFMDFNPSTKKNIVSLDKIQNLSRQIAKQAGLPETGYAQQRIATQMKAYVEHKQIEPAVEKEVYKILGNQTPQDIGKKDFEGYVKANSKIEGVKTQADIAQQTVASQINKEAKTAASQHKTQYKLLIADLNKRSASDPEIAEEANQIHDHYQQLVNEGKMPLETAQAESKAALNEFAQKKYGPEYANAFKQYADALNQNNTRYNRRYKREAGEIVSLANEKIKGELEKAQKEYKASPETIAKIKKAYEEAYGKVLKDKDLKEFAQDQKSGFWNQLANSTISSFGSGVSGYATTFGLGDVAAFGDLIANNFHPSNMAVSKAGDWLDPIKAAHGTGDLLGRMIPSIAVGVATAAATEGTGAPLAARLMLTGFADMMAETADISGTIYKQVLEKTGSAVEAGNAARDSFEGNMYNYPAYVVQGLPFFKNALKGVVGAKGVIGRTLTGAALELGSETFTESVQGAQEKSIMSGDRLKNTYKELTIQHILDTELQMAPIAIMGGAPHLFEGGKDAIEKNFADRAVKAYRAKEVLSTELNDENQAQFFAQIHNEKGAVFAKSMLGSLFIDGKITPEQNERLASFIDNYDKWVPMAKQLGLNGNSAKAGGILFNDLEQAKLSNDPQLIQQAQSAFDGFVKTGRAELIVVDLPDGSRFFYKPADFSRMLESPDFQKFVQNGEVKIGGMSSNLDTGEYGLLAQRIQMVKDAPNIGPTQLGGIPTVEAPDEAPEFDIEGQLKQVQSDLSEIAKMDPTKVSPEAYNILKAKEEALLSLQQEALESGADPAENQPEPADPQINEVLGEDAQETIQIQPLNIDFQKNEGRNVNYQGIEGRIKIDSDGVPYVFTKDGEVVYIEGGLSGQTPQQLGIQPLADDIVNEADIEMVLQDESAPLDQGQLEYDFDNNTLTLYGKPFAYDGVETNDKGQTTALRLIDQNGKTKYVRNEDVILEFEIQKEIYEKQPTAESIQQAATELQIEPAKRSEPIAPAIQQAGPVANTEGVAQVTNDNTPTTTDGIPTDAGIQQQTGPIATDTQQTEPIETDSEGMVDGVGNTQLDDEIVSDTEPGPLPQEPVVSETVEPPPNKTPATFKTAKGSVYSIGKNGRTTRNKSFHAEHGGDEGIKPESQVTFYLTNDEARKLAAVQAEAPDGVKLVVDKLPDGDVAARIVGGSGNGQIIPSSKVTPKWNPEVGLTPVEIWHNGATHHFGNEIIEITNETPAVPVPEPVTTDVAVPEATPPAVQPVATESGGSEVEGEVVQKPKVKPATNENTPIQGNEVTATEENQPENVQAAETGGSKPTPKQKLAAAHEKWKASQNKQGIIFDPKSQAENDIEFLKAILSYIKEEAITTYENFKKALKEFGVYDESKDEDWRAVFDKTQPEPQSEGELKERKTITSFKSASDISDAVKKALGGERTLYKELPNDVSVKEAKAIVDALGVEKSKALVLDGSTKIPGAFRTTVAQVLIKKYNELGDLSNAVSVAEGIAEMATDWGQAIQALSLFQYLTPEGQLLAAQRTINKLREKKFAKHKDKIDKIGKELKKANKDAVGEAVDKVVGRMGEIRTPPPVKRVKEYGSGNKIVVKSAYQKALSELKKIKFFSGADPSQLAIIAAYHVEAGARSFADFSKRMVEDLGKKVKPYLKSAYRAAQKELGGEGYSTDAEIAKHLTTGIEADIKSAMKELGVDVGKIIKAHYTEAESAKTSLVEKLTTDLGLDQSDAEMIAKAVEAEFNKIATDKKQKALQKLFGAIKRRSPEYKTLEKKLIELSNLGAFDEAALREAYADALGFPKLTEENAKEIKRLAEAVQKAPEGLFKHRATEDLLKYQAKLKGVDLTEVPLAIWMASVLSGPSTHAKNVVANTANATTLALSMIAQNPKSTVGIAKALGTGFMKGFIEALDVLATGYSPIKDKAQVPDVLEQKTFWGGKLNPFNYYKGVRRAMIASDVVVFEMLKEARAFQLAYIQGKSTNEALKILNNTSDDIQIAKDKAHAEYEEIVANINANTELSPSEKKEQISMAKMDSKRRFYDFLHQLRPEEITSSAHEFAEKGTFNHKPQGLLGVGANAINQIAHKMPWVRFIVPFTNVITNVANEMVNYSLIGAARANTRTGSLFGQGERAITPQEKKDLYAKAIMGTTATLMALALSQPPDDDEEEPMLQITADGYNDYGKNQDLKPSGWQPFSMKIGDSWVSYQYTPLFFALAPVGALRDYQKYHKGKIDDDYMDEWSFMFAAAFQAGLKTAGYLESVNGFLSAVLNAREGQKLFDKGASWLGKAGMATLPVVGTNFYQQLMNDYYSAMKSPEKEARNEWYGKILRNIPYARNGLKNAVNGLGEELPADTDILISNSRGLPSDKLWTLLSKNKANTGLTAPNRTTIISEDGTEKIMTSEQYYTFAKERGAFIREAMESNYDELAKMDEKKFGKAMKMFKTAATDVAKVLTVNPDAGVYKRIMKAELKYRLLEQKYDIDTPTWKEVLINSGNQWK